MKLAFILFFAICLTILSVSANTPQIHTQERESGHTGHDEKHLAHKQTKSSGKKASHHTDVGKKGEKLNEKHSKSTDEHGGKKTEHFSEDAHKSAKSVKGGASHGAKMSEGAHHKKGNYKRGFREQYHKDELKKHDSFYSNSHKSGEYNVYGKKNQKHQTNTLSKKNGKQHKAAKTEDHHGKITSGLGGHNIDAKKAHQFEKSAKSHHEHKDKWAKKGGKKGGKHYGVVSSPLLK